MPAKRLSVRKITEILRLKWANGLSNRQIARVSGIARPTVAEYLRRAAEAGLSWPIPAALDEAALERRLFPPPPVLPGRERGIPDWSVIHTERQRKGVTLFLLWQEYRELHPQGYQYSWFCEHYRSWQRQLDVVMRQDHRAGEKLFVDYAGQTVPVVDRQSPGADLRGCAWCLELHLCRGHLDANTAGLDRLPRAHLRCPGRHPGTRCAGQPHRYEPDMNPTYQDMAQHYGVTVLPARVRRPRDKAKVEVGVQVVERWILAVLRQRTFFSLRELNDAIREGLERLNTRPFKKLPGTRQELFDNLDKPALNPLPAELYVYAEWKKVRVHIDYHVEVDRHYYSVPHALIRKQLRHTTVSAHMPEAHRQMKQWSPQRLANWAAKTGPATECLITTILASRKHPQQAYRSCLGILRLGKNYGHERLEAACRRALTLGSHTYKSIESILRLNLDKQPLEEPQEPLLPDDHDNIRGPSYYH
jgi:transposase